MKKLLLLALLLPPWNIQAAPWNTDHRPDAIMVLGIMAFTGGIYLMYKRPADTIPEQVVQGLGIPVLMSIGIFTILNAKGIVKNFDDIERG